MNQNIKAHIALLSANIIYGLNYIIAKGIMPDYMSPRGIIFLRISGAVIVFNLIHYFFIKEKVDRKDLVRLAFCGLFGVAVNQIMFFEGLNLTTAINASIIMTTTPILTLIFSFMILREKLSTIKIIGIALGTAGAMNLILMGGQLSLNSNTSLGNLFVFINAVSFAIYLVIVKSMMIKYNPLTVLKWAFSFGLIYAFPFSFGEVIESDFMSFPTDIWLSILFVIFATTIIALFLINYSLKYVSPVVTSSYIYSQPVIASIIAILYLHETLSFIEAVSAGLIFIGVYFVSIRKKKRNQLGN